MKYCYAVEKWTGDASWVDLVFTTRELAEAYVDHQQKVDEDFNINYEVAEYSLLDALPVETTPV